MALHHQLRDALNASLKNKNFFVWINVMPTGDASRFSELDRMVERTEDWLSRLNPDAVREGDLPKLQLRENAASVEITALPRKREVRGYRAAEIVGNPEPVLTRWG